MTASHLFHEAKVTDDPPRHDDDLLRRHFRSSRFFNVEGGWYFTTREDGDHGPFASRDEAEIALGEWLCKVTGDPKYRREAWNAPGASS